MVALIWDFKRVTSDLKRDVVLVVIEAIGSRGPALRRRIVVRTGR